MRLLSQAFTRRRRTAMDDLARHESIWKLHPLGYYARVAHEFANGTAGVSGMEAHLRRRGSWYQIVQAGAQTLSAVEQPQISSNLSDPFFVRAAVLRQRHHDQVRSMRRRSEEDQRWGLPYPICRHRERRHTSAFVNGAEPRCKSAV